jgi:hypothetical protein
MGSREGMYRFRDETVSESGSKGVKSSQGRWMMDVVRVALDIESKAGKKSDQGGPGFLVGGLYLPYI